MDLEEKNILISVIGSMLPYGIKCVECDEYSHNDSNFATSIISVDRSGVDTVNDHRKFGEFDIYLRPMDDIRDDEVKDLFNVMFPAFEMIGYDLEPDRIRYRAAGMWGPYWLTPLSLSRGSSLMPMSDQQMRIASAAPNRAAS